MVILYVICFLLSIVNLLTLVLKGKKQDLYQLLLAVFIMIACGGYMAMAACDGSLDKAIYGNNVMYTGTLMIYPIMLFMTAEFCEVHINKYIKAIIVLMSMALLVCVYSVGYRDWYYITDSIKLTSIQGAYHIEASYGPAHSLYYVLIIGSMLAMLGMIISAGVGKKQVSFHVITTLATIMAIGVGVYAFEIALHSPIEWMPFAYNVLMLLFVRISYRMDTFDISNTLIRSFVHREGYGYAIFDWQKNYMNSNEVMKSVFTVFRNAKVDRPLTAGEDPIMDEMMAELRNYDGSAGFEKSIEVGAKIYRLGFRKYSDVRGEKIGYVMELFDETEQQRHLRELEAYSEKLKEAKLNADRANQAKSDFLANMSHEIRTPLNAIIGMNEMILRRSTQPEVSEYAAIIDSSSSGLLTIINDILDFSKIESGKMEIVEKNYSPGKMLQDLSYIFQNRIGAKDVELIYDIPAELPAVLLGDCQRIRQILINLVNNAIKFTDVGYVKIRLVLETENSSTVWLNFYVEDTGIGIAQDNLERLFHSFSQVDIKKNYGKEGTGLGLAISKQLVTLMNGEIGVESIYGEGSTFHFRIPQQIADGEIEPDELSEERLDFVAPEAQILVVDDNEINMKVIGELMSLFQITIDTADNGKTALAMMQKKAYDMVFMDHMMPVMDGLEVTARIRRQEESTGEHQCIIALSANATAKAQQMFRENGMDDFVSKPVRISELAQCLLRFLPEEKVLTFDSGTEGETGTNVSVPMDAQRENGQELPEIEGIDVKLGITYCNDRNLFFELLGDFCMDIDERCERMQRCLEEGQMRDFTIEVHGLKSTSRMIGATELSQLFYQMERLGEQENIEEIHRNMLELLSAYQEYKKFLAPYAPQCVSVSGAAQAGNLAEVLARLYSAAAAFDIAAADRLMKVLQNCEIPEEAKPQLEQLQNALARIDLETVMQIIRKMQEM